MHDCRMTNVLICHVKLVESCVVCLLTTAVGSEAGLSQSCAYASHHSSLCLTSMHSSFNIPDVTSSNATPTQQLHAQAYMHARNGTVDGCLDIQHCPKSILMCALMCRLQLNSNYSGYFTPFTSIQWDPACNGNDYARNVATPDIDFASLHLYPMVGPGWTQAVQEGVCQVGCMNAACACCTGCRP